MKKLFLIACLLLTSCDSPSVPNVHPEQGTYRIRLFGGYNAGSIQKWRTNNVEFRPNSVAFTDYETKTEVVVYGTFIVDKN